MPRAKASPALAPRGSRPLEITDDLADLICEQLADGRSLRKICADVSMPTKATVFRWIGRHPDFADRYACARESQADTHADDMIDIADDPNLDPHEKRIRIDTRKWLAGKQRPKKYGERIAHVGGGDGEAPIRLDLQLLTDEEIDARLAALEAADADQGEQD